jgi:hypothetical protein
MKNKHAMKKVIILSVLALLVGSCVQSNTKKQAETINQTISLDTVKETNDVPESYSEQPSYVSVLQNTLKCKHTKLSKQFDIDLTVEHYLDTVTYGKYHEHSIFVKLLIKDKKTQKLLDSILFVPGVGRYSYIDCKCNDVASYSTGVNVKSKTAGEGGILVVADLNFDGKDDIALINDMGASNGPYYAFFIQNNDNKFIKNDFLTDEVMLFPYEIDSRRRQFTTGWVTGTGCGHHIYQFYPHTNKWREIRSEWIGIDGHFVYQIDSITNEKIEISRKLTGEK